MSLLPTQDQIKRAEAFVEKHWVTIAASDTTLTDDFKAAFLAGLAESQPLVEALQTMGSCGRCDYCKRLGSDALEKFRGKP